MKRREFTLALAGTALASPGGSAPAHPIEGFAATSSGDDGWNIAAVDDDKLVDTAALSKMADRLAASGANIHAVLVVHRGKLVFERYLQGSDQVPTSFFGSRLENVAFDADARHAMKSVTKSVASLAVGIAIDRGLIHGVDEPILGFFPEISMGGFSNTINGTTIRNFIQIKLQYLFFGHRVIYLHSQNPLLYFSAQSFFGS